MCHKSDSLGHRGAAYPPVMYLGRRAPNDCATWLLGPLILANGNPAPFRGRETSDDPLRGGRSCFFEVPGE
jgi:hypothetical protein